MIEYKEPWWWEKSKKRILIKINLIFFNFQRIFFFFLAMWEEFNFRRFFFYLNFLDSNLSIATRILQHPPTPLTLTFIHYPIPYLLRPSFFNFIFFKYTPIKRQPNIIACRTCSGGYTLPQHHSASQANPSASATHSSFSNPIAYHPNFLLIFFPVLSGVVYLYSPKIVHL